MYKVKDRVVCEYRDFENDFIEHTQQVVVKSSRTIYTLSNGIKFRQKTNTEVLLGHEKSRYKVLPPTEENLLKVRVSLERKVYLTALSEIELDRVSLAKLKEIYKILEE